MGQVFLQHIPKPTGEHIAKPAGETLRKCGVPSALSKLSPMEKKGTFTTKSGNRKGSGQLHDEGEDDDDDGIYLNGVGVAPHIEVLL